MTKLEPLDTYTKLSVIVPVYNERNTIVEIVRRMRAVDLPIAREIIVVDDGSQDGTRDVLKQLDDSTVRVVYHDTNQGKGAALRTGLEHVTGDLVLTQDADLEYDPDDWPKLLGPVLKKRAIVVYGSRYACVLIGTWLRAHCHPSRGATRSADKAAHHAPAAEAAAPAER